MSENQAGAGVANGSPSDKQSDLAELNADLMKLVMGRLVSEVIHVAVQLPKLRPKIATNHFGPAH